MTGRTPWVAILALSSTMTIGWGSTYYVPAILAPRLREDLGLSQEVIFGGVTTMLLFAAVAGPLAGRLIEAYGAKRSLVHGSVLMACALVALALAQGPVSYLAPWVLLGLATPITLTQATVSAIAERSEGDARRPVSALLLLSGFSSTVFWPFTSWLAADFGWRGACLAFAGLHLLVCLPIHGILIGGRRDGLARDGDAPVSVAGAVPVPAGKERSAYVLMALSLSLAGFVSWGLPLQTVEIFTAFGHPTETAVWVATLMGPSQVLARLAEVAFGGRAGILNVGLISAGLMPLATLIPMLAGHSVEAAVVFMMGYGMSAGAMTIVRSVLPLALFGRERYARLLGQLALPQNAAFALSPVVFAAVMNAYGPNGALVMSFVVGTIAVAALSALVITLRRPG